MHGMKRHSVLFASISFIKNNNSEGDSDDKLSFSEGSISHSAGKQPWLPLGNSTT